VRLTYFRNGAPPVVRTLTVAATSCAAVAVHDEGLGVGRGHEVAASVTTTHPGGIVAEQPIYFRYPPAGRGERLPGGLFAGPPPMPTPTMTSTPTATVTATSTPTPTTIVDTTVADFSACPSLRA
jgi:hypothetical protein